MANSSLNLIIMQLVPGLGHIRAIDRPASLVVVPLSIQRFAVELAESKVLLSIKSESFVLIHFLKVVVVLEEMLVFWLFQWMSGFSRRNCYNSGI